MSTSIPEQKTLTPRGQRTRQKLLDAAESVFGERGFDSASIVEITRRAGVAQGTFYVYFTDKRAVFIELVQALSGLLRRETAKAVEGLDERLEIERVGMKTFFSFAQRHRNLYRIVRQAEFVDEEIFRWYYKRMAEGYTQGLKAAMEAGQMRTLDPETTAYCLMAITDFIGMRWVLWEGKPPPDDVFETVISFVLHGIGKDKAPN